MAVNILQAGIMTGADYAKAKGIAKSAFYDSFDGSFRGVVDRRIDNSKRLNVGYIPSDMTSADRTALFPSDLMRLFWQRCADRGLRPQNIGHKANIEYYLRDTFRPNATPPGTGWRGLRARFASTAGIAHDHGRWTGSTRSRRGCGGAS